MSLKARLAAREAEGTPIRVGIAGAGRFGTMIVCQLATMRGMRPSVVAELNEIRGLEALAHAGYPRDAVVRAGHLGQINDAIARGVPALTGETDLLVQSDVDVVVEATGVPGAAAATALRAIRHGKHVVMVTVEADVLVGAVLRRAAGPA